VAVGPGALEAVVTDVPEPTGFWLDKRVLLTGHTGFKGAWLALMLQRLGAQVAGLALAPATEPSLFDAARVADGMDSQLLDLRDAHAVRTRVRQARPQVVLHLAAQALVRASYRDPVQTLATNVMGTAHLLDALRETDDLRVVVVVTTDKVYRNREWAYPYREDDTLGGRDPYSASKAAAELVAACWRDAFLGERGVALATARAGNVIGGGDWSEDRLLPDAIRAWQTGRELVLRRPQAVRPWQHVLDPLAGYLRLAERLWDDPSAAGAYNLGPDPHAAATVRSVVERACRAYGSGTWRIEPGEPGPHEAGWLALETAHARQRLGIRPAWDLDESVRRSVQWYRCFADGGDAAALCRADIEAHQARLAAQESA
jgi:CDP-glucose 4,6-dehydratase